jgi:hypothetical protein
VIADNARALGVPMAARREKIWRWEHWGVIPERDSQRALARALGVPQQELDLRPWPGWLPTHDGVPVGLPWSPAGSVAALDALLDEGTQDNRGYPITAGTGLREAVAEWAAAVLAPDGTPDPDGAPLTRGTPPADGAPDPGTAAPEETVAWLESGVPGLRRLDDLLGGGAVRHRVEADLKIAVGLLRRGSHGRALSARLFRAAADLAQLGGWAAADCGHHGAAQRHFLTALRLAHSAGDRSAAVSAWAGLSLQAVFTGRCADALAAVEAADRVAVSGTRRTRAMLATRRARAHAGLRDADACRRALDDATALLDGAAEDGGRGEPSWLYWFDEAELIAQEGTALLHLDRPLEAAPVLERALAAQAPAYVRDRALYSARAASARHRCGDPDGARLLAGQAARLAAPCDSPRLTAALDALRAELG